MSRIEELPDDFDHSINLKDAPSKVAKEPPAAAAAQSSSHEDLEDYLRKSPLFMTDINSAGDENGDNLLLDALQALQNEGSRGEVAGSFKAQGNEAVSSLRWIDAKEFYTKALAVLNAKEDKWEQPEDPQEEAALLVKLKEASYSNRALCNLELGNYRSCTLDCAGALEINPKNIKAYYRSALALLKLDKIAEAEDSASRGLALDPGGKAFQEAYKDIAERKLKLERIAARKRAEEELLRKENIMLSTALRARQIRTRKTEQPPDLEDASIRLVPDPLSAKSTLEFPAVFLYPMEAQSDFVENFLEVNTISDHLDYLLPCPWDSKNEYTAKNVECFMQTVTGGLIKAGKSLTLLQILTGGKVEVVDQLVTIFVVPISKTGKFIADMKARKTG